jgi:poly-gamma-glutamate synthesis protein (capsule biosynthesis protein)
VKGLADFDRSSTQGMTQPHFRLTLALAGDAMLGSAAARRLVLRDRPLVSPEVVAVAAGADLFVLNLECALSDHPPAPAGRERPFVFAAPPAAAQALAAIGVDVVTLANNHALDCGPEALADTLRCLGERDVAWVGAGADVERARAPLMLERAGQRIAVIACSDHPADLAAGPSAPGIAYAPLDDGLPDWVATAVECAQADVVLVMPHWGPNLTTRPVARVLRAADELVARGATVVAGHSAHIVHGVAGRVLFDLGDFVDDGAVGGRQRRAVGLLWLVGVEAGAVVSVEAVPLGLEPAHTRLADEEEAAWMTERLRRACAHLGTTVTREEGRLVVALASRK